MNDLNQIEQSLASGFATVTKLKMQVLQGQALTSADALLLFDQPLEILCQAADEIRRHFCGNAFDLCTIINAKSGRCTEDCKYCAQSAHYSTDCDSYPLRSAAAITEAATYHAHKGVLRFSLVTSGRTLEDQEVAAISQAVQQIRETCSIHICGSFGLLNQQQYEALRQAGLERIHNNLETSAQHFPNMCTTHSFTDKIAAIQAAQAAGLTVCSGGIFGIGETNEDRVALAFALKALGVKSVPLNLLNPIAGTPYQDYVPLSAEMLCRIVAVYRFVLPDAFLRLAGGRGLLPDKGRTCFTAGANAAITGDMLTTSGISVETDLAMIRSLGFEVTAL